MIDDILNQIKDGKLSVEDAKKQLNSFENLGFAKVDHNRKERTGFPEVIYGEGKTPEQIISIIKAMQSRNDDVLATRVSKEKADVILQQLPECSYSEIARVLYWKEDKPLQTKEDRYIAIICAGTSDLAVAEEAALTAELFGSRVHRIYDVGVAGLHRLLHHLEEIQGATVSVVIAGMEGALASVVGGLVSHPVIAVPTSVGYGANLQGISTLLAMLNSCSSGTSVVNIDNGFGGAYNAVMIDRIARGMAID
ncbi:nickel pincer cofactor biosynthesis protein LarB [Aquibacillus salsiterrae]|uniref:Nickel pincer cofactor biosynthesis protein LarB n=1 Tax=Aquibacillus salsiterrae TaxID=2950439 RepID=A0A9X4ADY0_9BACI|nr:nickel pincer cofactor biosynthesis protein LarB [Aquibacillus salsiterrae]MDC3416092.1 nickel pincer cofactor biosynthesis protein LarB [Aquibacillus salsiterrae]